AVDSGGGHLHPQDSQCGAARGGGRALHPRGAGYGAAPRERGGWCAGGPCARGGDALVGDGRGAGRVMSAGAQAPADLLVAKAQDRSALIGIVGLGYVGLPLAMEFARAGFRVLGFDVSQAVVDSLTQGRSHVQDVPSADVARFTKEGKFTATTDLARLREPDVVSICVPTPLSKTKDPDVSYVLAATNSVKQALRRGQLIVLESTTYPGTTRELMLPALEETGLQVGEDFFLAFSPERVDPGNPKWNTHNTPKVVGGLTAACRRVAIAVYEPAIERLVAMSSTEAAELVKILENTFRSVNIGLVNEMAIVCDKLGVDVWEVIEAAATKPFGFMKFTPGPGVGGHCIPLDPHYLAWKMRTTPSWSGVRAWSSIRATPSRPFGSGGKRGEDRRRRHGVRRARRGGVSGRNRQRCRLCGCGRRQDRESPPEPAPDLRARTRA